MLALEIPAEGRDQFLSRAIELPRGKTQLWPGFPVQQLMDPRIIGSRFRDHELIDRELIDRAIAVAAVTPANLRGAGGKKVRDAETWNIPAAQLLSQRAMLLFCQLSGATSAHILDRWANVMSAGDYSAPHCHYDAEAAAVYFLDAGDLCPDDALDGAFELMDPRIPFCCTNGRERPIRGLLPEMKPGTMILFPAAFLHHVRPYTGRRPRLTLAWNISSGPPPKDRAIDPTQAVPLQTGRM
jgi:hypothetical protein